MAKKPAPKPAKRKAAKKPVKKAASKPAKKPAKKAAAKAPAKKAPAKKAAPKKPKGPEPVPSGYHTLTPYLIVRGGSNAIDFYVKAFGATERARLSGPHGEIWHAELQIGDSVLMLGDEMPAMGITSPQSLNGTATGVFLYVPNVDASWEKAVAAGCEVLQPLQNQFWGDRYGKLKDPFGHQWSMATHVEDVSPEEMKRRADDFAKQMEASSGSGS